MQPAISCDKNGRASMVMLLQSEFLNQLFASPAKYWQQGSKH